MTGKNTLTARNGANGIELFDNAGVVRYVISFDRNKPSAWIVNVIGGGRSRFRGPARLLGGPLSLGAP